MGWTELMPVQRLALPYLFAGRDVMVQSRTGSGKTGAFVLPILDRIDPDLRACQALVLVPTRELARQVEHEASLLAGDSGIRTVAVYGGTAYGPQCDAFARGAHLVVGTPGRILDHLLKRTLDLAKIEMLILDEADRMLSMGFYPDMQRIRGYLPKRRINACLFSATFPLHVVGLSREFLHEPETLSLSKDHVHVTDVVHSVCVVPGTMKDRSLVRLLEVENPSAAIVFCNMKRTVHFVNIVLKRFGWDSDELSSDLTQEHRDRVLQRVRDGKLRVLVATDVAGRGIDIPELSHVFQYEPPIDPESYIHRAGRTGRAGASGRAITLVAKNSIEEVQLKGIAKEFGIEMAETPVPTEEEISDLLDQRITARLEAGYRARGEDDQALLQGLVPLARAFCASEERSVRIALLLDDYHHRDASVPTYPARDDDPKEVARRVSPRLIADVASRDQIQLERLQRLVPLARRLCEIDDEAVLIAMLLDDYDQRPPRLATVRPRPDKSPERPSHGGGPRRGGR
ncbi:MAG: DEAD/DEAH box helicase [Planctomycetes bacterium]|nr:DEAD/DEAH box helicase [Planctomycetota bacterium]